MQAKEEEDGKQEAGQASGEPQVSDLLARLALLDDGKDVEAELPVSADFGPSSVEAQAGDLPAELLKRLALLGGDGPEDMQGDFDGACIGGSRLSSAKNLRVTVSDRLGWRSAATGLVQRAEALVRGDAIDSKREQVYYQIFDQILP